MTDRPHDLPCGCESDVPMPVCPRHGSKKARRLKVYSGNLDGRRCAIMAATSFVEFSRATGITRNFGGETGFSLDVAAAMARPGVLFTRPIGRCGPYGEIPRKDKP